MRFLLLFLVCLVTGGCGAAQPQTGQTKPKSKPAPSTSSSAPAAVWSYRMKGNLDSANLQCSGSAAVTQTGPPAAPRCLNWRIVKQQCSGSHDVDWLHEDDLTGQICESAAGWELKKDLPGRGVCRVTAVQKNDRVESVSLSCTWECRSAANPCAGQATYTFTRNSQ